MWMMVLRLLTGDGVIGKTPTRVLDHVEVVCNGKQERVLTLCKKHCIICTFILFCLFCFVFQTDIKKNFRSSFALIDPVLHL